MKLSNQDFDLMLNAAWSSFESTLFLWGISREELEAFTNAMYCVDGYTVVGDIVKNIVELEDE